jgi:hypothetical protein
MKANPPPFVALMTLCLSLFLSFSALGGPLSTLYLTNTLEGKLYAVQGSSVTLNVAATSTGQSPIAVGSTIRTFGADTGISGAEYSLSGTATGSVYPNTFGNVAPFFVDGATDGLFNYAWDFGEGRAYRFNLDWSSPTVLFTLGNSTGTRAGITYDPTSNTLWLTGVGASLAGRLEQYTLDGVILASYSTGTVGSPFLAFDPADQSLWLRPSNSPVFQQYSTAGVFLSSETYPSLAFNGLDGAEFAVPEPTCALLLLSGAVFCLRRRTFRTHERSA